MVNTSESVLLDRQNAHLRRAMSGSIVTQDVDDIDDEKSASFYQKNTSPIQIVGWSPLTSQNQSNSNYYMTTDRRKVETC